MWKIAVGFALFAALSIFVIIKAGDKADMGGKSTVLTPCMCQSLLRPPAPPPQPPVRPDAPM